MLINTEGNQRTDTEGRRRQLLHVVWWARGHARVGGTVEHGGLQGVRERERESEREKKE